MKKNSFTYVWSVIEKKILIKTNSIKFTVFFYFSETH